MAQQGDVNYDIDDTRMTVGRIESFSDGVFAVAATLLILNIHIPQTSSGHISDVIDALLSQWPAYLSYFITFMTMGRLWIAHHRMFKCIRFVDLTLQMLNLLFLMFIVLMPLTTAFLAEYMQQSNIVQLVAIIYGSHWAIIGILTANLWSYARRAKLLKPNIDPDYARQITRGPRALISASVGVIIAFFWPELSVVLYLLIALFYMYPLLHLVRPISKHQ